MKNLNTVELLEFLETIFNTNSKPFEFEGFRIKKRLKIYEMAPKNLIESINSLLIQQNLQQNERIIELNKVAISQMVSLVKNRSIQQLK